LKAISSGFLDFSRIEPAQAEGPPGGWWRQELLAVAPGVVLHGPGEPCTAVVYLSTGSATYQGYSLEGGL
jgi:hypothetical protein